MDRIVVFIKALSVLTAVVASGWAAETGPEQGEVAAEIQNLGGKVVVESLDNSVIAVNLGFVDVTSKVLEHLKRLSKLRSLDLWNSNLTDAGLQQIEGLSNLELLNAGFTEVTDAGLAHIAKLTSLQSLGLTATKVTDVGLEQLKGLSNLESLSLWHTKITDAGLKSVKSLVKLKGLDLGFTRVTDAGIENLKRLASLSSLSSFKFGLRRPNDARY